MRRLAVFVEGQTELIFVERLLQELAGYQRISIRLERKVGDGIVSLKGRGSNVGGETYAVLIYDCQGEGSVKTAMLERMADLKNKGYQTILGLLDLYPIQLADRKKFIRGVNAGLALQGVKLQIVVAVMEVEAWFVKESHHFLRLHPALDPASIKRRIGFNPDTDDVTLVRHPSTLLHRIYRLVGREYKKKEGQVRHVVSLLDYDNLYVGVTKQVESLAIFLQHIDEYLAAQ